jgi:ribosome biogenesis GTPase
MNDDAGLSAWGWTADWQTTWQELGLTGSAQPGRILSQRDDIFTVAIDGSTTQAHSSGSLFQRSSEEERPAVGDWVAVELTEDNALVTQVLPRNSRFMREAVLGRGVAQMVAANVDVIFVVCPISNFNANRIERLLLAICGGGAEPMLVLTKGDLISLEEKQALVLESSTLMEGLTVVCTSSARKSPELVRAEFEPLLEVGKTYALIGTSGAGKSTLINCLMGEERQMTGEVRDSDGKGRHVTSFRELFALPGGALVMDTPGMREFAVWSEAGGLERVFADIVRLAEQCKFSNCAHQSEPGCAIQSALASGTLALRRFENWRTLDSEMEGNLERRSVMEGRRQRVDYQRKKTRDQRYSKR